MVLPRQRQRQQQGGQARRRRRQDEQRRRLLLLVAVVVLAKWGREGVSPGESRRVSLPLSAKLLETGVPASCCRMGRPPAPPPHSRPARPPEPYPPRGLPDGGLPASPLPGALGFSGAFPAGWGGIAQGGCPVAVGGESQCAGASSAQTRSCTLLRSLWALRWEGKKRASEVLEQRK